MKYNLPGPPTARAARRQGDLQHAKRAKQTQVHRRDRRRAAFRTMKRRKKIVRDYRARRTNGLLERDAAQHTAERFQCSARSVRRFDRQFRKKGTRGLLPCYQNWQQPYTQWPWYVIQIVLALRTQLRWCGQRIASELAQCGIAQMSHMTVYRILRRYHVKTRTYHPVGKRHGINYRKQQVKAPNWTWHIDFAGPWEDAAGVKRSLVVVVDSYSRMMLALKVIDHQNSATVEQLLDELFVHYGTPQVLISDNGRAFAPSKAHWEHRFEKFLAGHGVEHRRSKPYYPQTNGKVEALIKTIERELMARLGRRSGAQWQWSQIKAESMAFQGWYNFYRGHGAIGYAVPASRYAGIGLEKEGISHIWGLDSVVSEPTIVLAALPKITKSNRLERLALAIAA